MTSSDCQHKWLRSSVEYTEGQDCAVCGRYYICTFWHRLTRGHTATKGITVLCTLCGVLAIAPDTRKPYEKPKPLSMLR